MNVIQLDFVACSLFVPAVGYGGGGTSSSNSYWISFFPAFHLRAALRHYLNALIFDASLTAFS